MQPTNAPQSRRFLDRLATFRASGFASLSNLTIPKRYFRRAGALAAALVAIFALFFAVTTSSAHNPRRSYATEQSAFRGYPTERDAGFEHADSRLGRPAPSARSVKSVDSDESWKGPESAKLKSNAAGVSLSPTSSPSSSPLPIPELADRRVIRKATIELNAADVRIAFEKVSLILSEANGEYVEQSSLTGQNARSQATLTLRVAANRLSTVLKELRDLGVVTSESSGGEDVTEQAVDLDARLANERRIERELLGLLDSRANAPLAEVLALREHVSRIRETIERMDASRARLARLVSLATVLVVLRSDGAPIVTDSGIGERFTASIAQAWTNSLARLVDTAAWLVFTAIAGLPYWITGFVCILIARALWKRTAAAPLSAPIAAPAA